jgi:hypothetical protein
MVVSEPARRSTFPPGRASAATPSRYRAGPAVVAGIGFVLAIAGTLSTAEGPPSLDRVASRIAIPLPGWLVAAALAALSVASLAFLATALPRRRRRKNDDDDFVLYHEPRRIPPLVAVALIVAALMPGALLGGAIFWFGHENITLTPRPGLSGVMPPPSAVPAPPAIPHPELPRRPASPITTGLIGTLALLVGFGSLGFVLWLRYGDRLMPRLPPDFKELGAHLGSAIAESLDDLRREGDPRAAIIKTYGQFERVLATASMPRRPWETPLEFMRSVLRRLPLPPAAVDTLTRLFEVARFSEHPLAATDRDDAWRALVAIRAALDHEALNRETLNRETLDRETLDREILDREILDREILDRAGDRPEKRNAEIS